MRSLIRLVLSGLASRLRESPFRTLGVLGVVCLAEIVRYFPEWLPRWAYFGAIGAGAIGLVVIGWPLLTIGRSGRDALAQREHRLRKAEANPLAAKLRDENRSADA